MFPCVPFFSLIVGPKIFLNKMSTTCHKSFELKCGCCIWIPMAISGFWLLGKTGETRHRAVPGCTPHHPLACSSSDLIKQMQTHSEDLRRSQKISEGIATTEPLLLLLLILRASLLALFVSTGRPTHFLIPSEVKRYRDEFKEKQGGVIGITLNMDWRWVALTNCQNKNINKRTNVSYARNRNPFLEHAPYHHTWTQLTQLALDSFGMCYDVEIKAA